MLAGFDAVELWADADNQHACRQALANREGPLLPLITERDFAERCVLERHVCIDTPAAGGNAALLASLISTKTTLRV